jgi:hypothetical protein
MPTFSEFREQLWKHTKSRQLLDALDTMYDRLRNETFKAIDSVAKKTDPATSDSPPDSQFVHFDAPNGDHVRVLALRYEAAWAAVSKVFDRRRHRRRKEAS